MDDRTDQVLEIELQAMVLDLLQQDGFDDIRVRPRLASGLRPDFLATRRGRPVLIEVRSSTPRTRDRLSGLVNLMADYRAALTAVTAHDLPISILVVPGSMGPSYEAELGEAGISVWDGDEILERARNHPQWEGSALLRTIAEQQHREPSRLDDESGAMLHRLRETNCGRESWVDYQKLCAELVEYLFTPPLEAPIYESATASRANRRDIILPNYAPDGFWAFMRVHYQADHVVIDAKNSCRPVGKNAILQMANYLSQHGTGLFGLILARSGHEDPAAEWTRREQWIIHRKLIVLLGDEDLGQMLYLRARGGQPGVVIRQRIEDFRLSI